MKHIEKGEEPNEFSEWKQLENDDWQPSYAILSGDLKRAVKNALMDEQGHICCYCERRLVNGNSHIEHFRPQSDPAVDPLDFSNMLCSCQNRLEKGEPRHCGNLKEDWFDEELLISPIDPECEDLFSYTGNGEICPQSETDRAAVETIIKLGLDISKLKAQRRAAIEPFIDNQIELSPDEFRTFVAGYLQRDEQGHFGEFWTTIKFLFGE